MATDRDQGRRTEEAAKDLNRPEVEMESRDGPCLSQSSSYIDTPPYIRYVHLKSLFMK